VCAHLAASWTVKHYHEELSGPFALPRSGRSTGAFGLVSSHQPQDLRKYWLITIPSRSRKPCSLQHIISLPQLEASSTARKGCSGYGQCYSRRYASNMPPVSPTTGSVLGKTFGDLCVLHDLRCSIDAYRSRNKPKFVAAVSGVTGSQ
jgi:hypothetical protein